jgi:outer membrane receptor for ferrienterochelin and colicin
VYAFVLLCKIDAAMSKILTRVYCVFLFLMAGNASAQFGTISGHVVDEKSGEDLVGVIVQIPSLGLGAATDLFGVYTINKVPAGEHKVSFNLVSYAERIFERVVVVNSETFTLDAALSNASLETGVVNIVGERITNSEAAIVIEMKEAKGVVSGIGGAQIAKSQDRNASEVARRIPGVTIVDNRFVMVRGLSERYNAVLMNGVQIPSLEADVKSFSFDLIPSSTIDRFLIFKSPSPELQGEFAGGAIQVYTKNIPDYKLSIDWSLGTGWRSGTTGQSFITNTNASTEKFGFDHKVRILPNEFPENVRSVTDPDELTRVGQSLKNDWALVDQNAAPDTRTNLTIANRFATGKLKWGQMTNINYSQTKTFIEASRLDYNVFDETTQKSDTVFQYGDDIYQKNVNLGLIHNWGMSYRENHFEWKNFLNQSGLQSNTLRTGRAIEEGNYRKEYSLNYNQRNLLASQLLGKHSLFNKRGQLDWTLGFGQSKRSDPDWKRIRYTSPLDGSDTLYHAYVPFGAQPFYLGRLFLRMNETVRTYAFNYTHKIVQTGEKDDEPTFLELKTGLYLENKDRFFAARNIGYAQANTFSFDYGLDVLPIDQILDPKHINSTTGFKLDEDTKGSDSYTASNDLSAAYAMILLPYKRWRVNGGVRLERSNQILNSATLTGQPIQVVLDTTVILPSINVAFELNSKMLLRAAYGKTVNRPEFRELAPYSFYDFEQNFIINGNPQVTIASVDNYDLRLERYPRPGEVISVSGFYKSFTNPIEMYFAPGVGSGGTRSFTPGNAIGATSYGVELDARKSLKDVVKNNFIQSLSFVANASLIKSRVEVSDEGLETGLSSNRPLMGQSPYIVNAGLYYQNDSSDVQVALLYNVIGPRISIVGIPGNPEVYEMQRHVLDLTITKTFADKYSIRFGVQDALNQDIVLLQDANQDGVLNKSDDQRLRSFNRGTYYSLAFIYKFRKK